MFCYERKKKYEYTAYYLSGNFCFNLYWLYDWRLESWDSRYGFFSCLSLTGCLAPSEALAYFSNNNVIMIGAMSVVAAGFNRTKFCTDLATGISKMAKGSLSKVLLMYCILAMLLTQMVQSRLLFLVLWLLFVWLLQKAWGFPKPKFLYHLALLPYQPAVHFQLVPVQLRLRN